MDILNIDSLATVRRFLKFKGISYEVQELSVQDYIDNISAAEALEAQGEKASAVDSMRLSIQMVQRSIPTMPMDVIARMNPEQLSKVLEFIRGELDNGGKAAAEGAESEKKAT